MTGLRRRAWWGATLALTLVLAPAAAFAAGQIEASPDGVNWGSGLPVPLFDGVSLVPMGNASAPFQLRNSGDEPGYLRVVVQDVSSDSTALLDALSIALEVDGTSGPLTPVGSAAPCRVVFEGELLAGESVPVLTTVSLGNLSGSQGQGATAHFALGIELTDSSPGSLLPTDCGSPETVIEITPFDNRVATLVALGVEPNTARLLEEYWVVLLLAALLAGVAAQWAVAESLRRRDERMYEQLQYLEDLA